MRKHLPGHLWNLQASPNIPFFASAALSWVLTVAIESVPWRQQLLSFPPPLTSPCPPPAMPEQTFPKATQNTLCSSKFPYLTPKHVSGPSLAHADPWHGSPWALWSLGILCIRVDTFSSVTSSSPFSKPLKPSQQVYHNYCLWLVTAPSPQLTQEYQCMLSRCPGRRGQSRSAVAPLGAQTLRAQPGSWDAQNRQGLKTREGGASVPAPSPGLASSWAPLLSAFFSAFSQNCGLRIAGSRLGSKPLASSAVGIAGTHSATSGPRSASGGAHFLLPKRSWGAPDSC